MFCTEFVTSKSGPLLSFLNQKILCTLLCSPGGLQAEYPVMTNRIRSDIQRFVQKMSLVLFVTTKCWNGSDSIPIFKTDPIFRSAMKTVTGTAGSQDCSGGNSTSLAQKALLYAISYLKRP